MQQLTGTEICFILGEFRRAIDALPDTSVYEVTHSQEDIRQMMQVFASDIEVFIKNQDHRGLLHCYYAILSHGAVGLTLLLREHQALAAKLN